MNEDQVYSPKDDEKPTVKKTLREMLYGKDSLALAPKSPAPRGTIYFLFHSFLLSCI